MGTLQAQEDLFYNLSKADLYDLFAMVVLAPIGKGAYRDVFAWGTDYVVKYERVAASFCNAAEMRLWRAVKDGRMAKWFAPCLAASPNGAWLIQKRTTPVTLSELKRERKRIPSIFTDLKVGNWGRYKGQIVCHDYANIDIGGALVGMRAAKWWAQKPL